MKKITALILFSCLTALSSRADVIFQDLFQYTNGPIIATGTNVVGGVLVSNWVRFSGSASPSDLIVNNNRLEVSTTTANGGVTVTRQDDCGRMFSITNNSPYTNVQQVIYVSFIINFTNLPTANGAYFAMFKNGAATSTFYEGKLWALIGNPAQTTNNFATLPNTLRLGVSANNSLLPSKVLPLDLALNTPYQVVLGWDPVTLDALTIWINPISASDPSATSSDSFVPSASNLADNFSFRQASGFGGFLTVSNLVVATTFAEAVTNVLATNAVAPTVIFQPVGTTNFVGASVNLTALAAGQGQGSLTYQWFKGTAPYTNPNGNTNVLNIASAATTDSGSFTLVVTTPYGLSATSSVAKVLISSAPVPPQFVVQPASTNVFTGQSILLSTTVISPGNVSYTWYSNNVVVSSSQSPAAGQVDSGDTSTLELDSLQLNNSATYKVAITNDIVVNGVVSTNAVLTVHNPSTVSIAYLRSLVDTNNGYGASPSIPYQVTGTVTTFTNITTGNTASYYLQDGTAGINIFITGGSSFRPAQGDVVTFVGVLSSFTSGLELYADSADNLYPYTSYTDTGVTNALPAPIAISFDVTNNANIPNVNFTIAGSLVKLSDVYFGTNSGMVLSNTVNNTVSVTNSSGKHFNLFFSFLDQDTAGQTLPAYAYNVTGVMYGINTNFSVAVTRFADINSTVPPPVPIPLSLSHAAGVLTFNWTDASFNLQAATNVAGPYTTITGAAPGFTTNTTSGKAMFFRLSHP